MQVNHISQAGIDRHLEFRPANFLPDLIRITVRGFWYPRPLGGKVSVAAF